MNLNQIYNFYSKRKKAVHFRNLLKKYKRESSPVYETDRSYLKQVRKNFRSVHPYYRDTKWHAFYQSLNNRKELWYVPEDIYYLAVEPYLVNYDLALAYVDKNNYRNLFGDSNHPETVLQYIKGRFHNSSVETISENEAKSLIQKTTYPLIVKPTISSSGGGRNVRLFSSDNDNKNLIPYLKSCTEDFIVQKKIEQNSQLSEFNSSSVNTLRILTFRYGKDILHLSTVARFGRANSITDNKAGGGVFISVKPNGCLNNFGYRQNYLKIDKHPDSLKPFKGTKIDGFEKAVKLCLRRHKRLPYFDLISWDIAIDEQNEPVMIELNLINQEINFHQVANGPLFGDYSEEIIKKSIKEMNKSKYALTSF